MKQENNKVQIQYFQLYAADFLLYKSLLSNEELIEVIEAISINCLFNREKTFKNEYQNAFYEKLKMSVEKNKKLYKISVENGKKGGRPKIADIPEETQKKPSGFLKQNPEETQSETNIIEYNKIENNIKKENKKIKKEEKELKKYGEFQNVKLTDEQFDKLKAIYNSKIDVAIEILSNYLAAKGDKYKNHYAVLNKSNWVYNKVFIDKKPEPEPYNVYM